MEKENDNLHNLKKNVKSLENSENLKKVSINLKDLDITGEDEHISISFNKEDLEQIKNGETDFLLVSGRRC